MSSIVTYKQPCLDTGGCGSSDARQIYEDGSSFCFSCQRYFKSNEEVEEVKVPAKIKIDVSGQLAEIKEYAVRGFRERGIMKSVTEFYGVRVSFGTDGKFDAHYYPYEGGKAYKKRLLIEKDFRWIGKSQGLFGKELFNGAGRRLIIAEGEIDTLSIAQASYDKYKKMYPIVGLSSSAMSKHLLKDRDWIRSFKEVVLCFDEDDAGEHARSEAIKIIGVDKVKTTKLPENDANDVFMSKGGNALLQCIFEAAPYVPAGIIGKEALWESLVEYNSIESIPYPECLDGLNQKLKGKRGGEIALFISGTGSGKSTILREIMLDTILASERKIGIISLEESPAETARKLAGMQLRRNPAEEEIPLDDLKKGFDVVFNDDRIVLLDHQGSVSDHSIVDQLEYMALSGCEELYIDHITILVSEGVENLTGLEAQDKMMNDLLRLVKRHPKVWIGLISHLRKVPSGKKSFEQGVLPTLDDIRGSGSIKQVSFDIVAFARDMTAESEKVQNTIKMTVLKSRFTGLTGKVEGAFYNHSTGRLSPSGVSDFEVLENQNFTKI